MLSSLAIKWALGWVESNWKLVIAVVMFTSYSAWVYHSGEMHVTRGMARDAAKQVVVEKNFQSGLTEEMDAVAALGVGKEAVRAEQKKDITVKVQEHAKKFAEEAVKAAAGPAALRGAPVVNWGLTDDGLRLITEAIDLRRSKRAGSGDGAVLGPAEASKP